MKVTGARIKLSKKNTVGPKMYCGIRQKLIPNKLSNPGSLSHGNSRRPKVEKKTSY